MTFCNLIGQPMTTFRGFTTCGYNAVQPQTSIFNNAYTNSVTNRFTNVNNTFINQDNVNISYNNNVTINNFYGKNYGVPYGPKVNNFLNKFRQPIVKGGCGCKQPVPQIGCAPQRRGVWQNLSTTFRNFMNFRNFRFINA